MSTETPHHVLLAEDDPIFVEQLHKVFSQMPQPWQVHAAPSGVAALRLHKTQDLTQAFSLAVIDIGLPDMSGIEVITALHQSAPQLPILVASNFQTEDTFLAAIRAGAHGYLLKSDSEVVLAHAIERVLSGEFPVSPALARYLFKLAGSPAAAPPTTSEFTLSRRERELLQHIAHGHSYTSCADTMFISLSTVQTHIRNIYRKLDVRNGRQAINKAKSAGLIRV
jgi:two-component system, NarL family, nitrate/nitrite response regulator NarL